MCGVAGYFSTKRPVPLRTVYQMVEGLKHRGPDGIGVYPWKPEANGWYYALLGHARLQLVGDTNAGRQPLASMDGTCIASVNGEIYNYRSLWAEHFPGTPFDKAWSDCKVVADLYSKLGLMGISLLEGIYAGAILDVSTGSMVAFRDHFGTKPLYYTFARQSAYVCSEIRPLLAAANIRPEYSRQALLDYFHYQTPLGDRTLFSGVYTIPPGTAVTFSDNGIEHSIVPSPWRESQRAEHYPSLEQASQEYRRRFAGVMDRQWHPMAGAFLSGGTDSNSITSTLTKLGHRIPTYTARFATDSLLAVDSGADESSIGACLAKEYGLPHTSVAIDPDHLVAEMSQMIRHLEDLRGPMSLGAWRIAQVATGQCRVLFSGMGADEILGGYVDRIRLFSSRSPLTYGVFDELWGSRMIPREEARSAFRGQFSREFSEYRIEDALAGMLLPILDSRSPDAISDCAALRFDQTFFLPSLLHVEDRMCMAHSIESRVPFLDPTLIRLVRAIPDGLFPRTTLGKELLRAAMVEVVPDSVLRRNKQPFRVPESSWYSGELHPWLTRKLLSADSALLELFNRGWLEQLVASHRQKRVNRKSLLWGLVCLEEWFNVFL